ncbi:MAG: purine-nucleoside phosphorylase [Fusobacteriaceae bacterium]|nr:purine-nucleoside phosphorylase [Fusobacteriaceae bacterium]MBP9510835.1 purine-nucleoside phosphorylase [Fusobacteriaceae bacterium]
MATPHIRANKGDIAETVLLPGDPLRAKWIAETFLTDIVCYNDVRGMFGFTGLYKGKKVSVQGTGMGAPSIGIYTNELISEFGCKNLIRVGTAGSYREDIKVRDVVIAMSSSSTSGMNRLRFNGADYAPTANFELFNSAVKAAERKNIAVKAGNVLTADEFYSDDFDDYKKWAKFGVLCVEMETSALYTIAAKLGARALTILTISDSLVTGEAATSEERQTTLKEMIEIALEAALEL